MIRETRDTGLIDNKTLMMEFFYSSFSVVTFFNEFFNDERNDERTKRSVFESFQESFQLGI